jgi:hypothetical protein
MEWRDSVVRVVVRDGKGTEVSQGTGFLAAADLILTALHVVAKKEADPPRWLGDIQVEFLGAAGAATTMLAKVVDSCWDTAQDWVLLRCEAPAKGENPPPSVPEGVHPLPLVRNAIADAKWQSRGYPGFLGGNPFDIEGTITNPSTSRDGIPAIALYSPQAAAGGGLRAQGFSGSPVVMKRDAPGAPDSHESVVVGLLTWTPKDPIYGRSEAGTLYACPIGPILDRCAGQLPDYDAFPQPLIRGIRGAPRLLARRLVGVLRLDVPLWMLLPFIPLIVAFLVFIWPDEWAWRWDYPWPPHQGNTQPMIALTPSFPELDPEFQPANFLPFDDPDKQSELMLNCWKAWIADSALHCPGPNEAFLTAEMSGPFQKWYNAIDAEVRVTFDANGSSSDAWVVEAAAFLVLDSADKTRSIQLPRFRQQLIFADAHREHQRNRRPCMLYISPPNPKERLLLVLHVAADKPLPGDPTMFKVALVKSAVSSKPGGTSP